MNKESRKEIADERQSVNVREPQSWRSQEVEWFIHFWNEQRIKYRARLPQLDCLTHEQTRELKFRQADWGVEKVRQMVINAMQSDYLNCRTGKRARNDLDFLLSAKYFPRVMQGRYNDLPIEERPKTIEEQRREADAARRLQEAARRAENRAIEEQIRAEERQRRNAMSRGCVTYEQYLAMKGNINLTEI